MSPGFWLHHAALAWKQSFDRRLRPLTLTSTQFILLSSIGWLAHTTSQPPTQQEAADLAAADRMMTSKVLQTLEERGLVSKEPDPADARVKRLRLTEEGLALVRQGIRIAVDLDEELFGPDADPFREHLQRITAQARKLSSATLPALHPHARAALHSRRCLSAMAWRRSISTAWLAAHSRRPQAAGSYAHGDPHPAGGTLLFLGQCVRNQYGRFQKARGQGPGQGGAGAEAITMSESTAMGARRRVVVDVYLLLSRDGRILLSQRANTGYGDGAYEPPSGQLAERETIVETAIRIAAGLGILIAAKQVTLAHVMHDVSGGGRIAFFLDASAWDGEPAADLRWFPFRELPTNMLDRARVALRDYSDGMRFSTYPAFAPPAHLAS
jgi:DNA-binding MarR family transcriptional regulator/ADP-ribose pyrophosphatase YjhB (NUDIX family)